ncbi:hypothetical protein BIW11_12135 [Tropilaelaps mercedesae]|uniref:Uncharacterized protein n=1 Tax=Tropilaelaps mercedesae TaxID=418985 RepID=A0A1V9X7V8_9ACAR|nr:hypothetical protein BIW11_12135 [Tropilaelaps mercedesae]
MACTGCCQRFDAHENGTKSGGSKKLFYGFGGKKVHPILEQIQNGHNGLHISGSVKNGGPEASNSGITEWKYSGPAWTIT